MDDDSSHTFDLWEMYDSLKQEFSEKEDIINTLCVCGSNDIYEIDSMNVSVAAGILIFEAKRQRKLH